VLAVLAWLDVQSPWVFIPENKGLAGECGPDGELIYLKKQPFLLSI